MARMMFAALAGAMFVASPVLANSPVLPSVATVKLQPANMQAGARIGAQINGKKRSDVAPAVVGGILAAVVAGGTAIGIATSGNGGGSTSP